MKPESFVAWAFEAGADHLCRHEMLFDYMEQGKAKSVRPGWQSVEPQDFLWFSMFRMVGRIPPLGTLT
jgi:hypothetical protein